MEEIMSFSTEYVIAGVVIGLIALIMCFFGYKTRRVLCALKGVVVGAIWGAVADIIIELVKKDGISGIFDKLKEIIVTPFAAIIELVLSNGTPEAEEAFRASVENYFKELGSIVMGEKLLIAVIIGAIVMLILHIVFYKFMYAFDTGVETFVLLSVPAALVIVIPEANIPEMTLPADGMAVLAYIPVVCALCAAVVTYAIFDVRYILATAVIGGLLAAFGIGIAVKCSMDTCWIVAMCLTVVGAIFQLVRMKKKNVRKVYKKALSGAQ